MIILIPTNDKNQNISNSESFPSKISIYCLMPASWTLCACPCPNNIPLPLPSYFLIIFFLHNFSTLITFLFFFFLFGLSSIITIYFIFPFYVLLLFWISLSSNSLLLCLIFCYCFAFCSFFIDDVFYCLF